MVHSAVPTKLAGGLTHSSVGCGILSDADGQTHTIANYPSHGKPSDSFFSGSSHLNLSSVSGNMNNAALNGLANSGTSFGASSLVTDANSGLSGGNRYLQRSPSIHTESYGRLPSSPMSFTSNNGGVSGSPVIEGSHQNSGIQQVHQGQPHQSSPNVTSPQTGQASLPTVSRVPGSLIQDSNCHSQVQKKPRLEVKHEDLMQQQALQQLLQRQDPMQLQCRNPQIQALLQQQRLRQQQQQQQQLLQSLPPLQRAQFQQQQQQMQLRQQLQQQGMQQASAMKRPFESGLCARRLMQYLYHRRQRPPDNSIAYWRKFVTEYYSPHAKKKLCLSQYDNVGQQALGVFPQAAMEMWQCDICGSKSGRGFEATYDILARLEEIKFGSGVVDELWFLDLPNERQFPSGIMMLEYRKAVQDSVYEQCRVIREGILRLVFTPALKILSWEFCARRHEELLPRRLLAPQVNRLLVVAQRCQSTVTESGSDGVFQEELQENSDMVLSAGRQLAKTLDSQSLNDLGFSKRYVRSLQISEVVNSMKDLMNFCHENKVGPIEGLKNFPRRTLQLPKAPDMEQLANNKMMALNPGINPQMSNNSPHIPAGGALSGTAQAAFALPNHQNMVMRQNSMNPSPSPVQPEASPSFSNNTSQSPASSFQGHSSFMPTPAQPQLHTQPQPQPIMGRSSPQNVSTFPQQCHPQSSQGNNSHVLQQQMMNQLMQDIISNNNNHNGGGCVQQQQYLTGQGAPVLNGGGGGVPANNNNNNRTGFATPSTSNISGGNGPQRAPSRTNSFKGTCNGADSSMASVFSQRQPTELPPAQELHLPEDIVPDISGDFPDEGFFNSDFYRL